MEADAIAQLVTLLMVGLGIVWHQQRSTDKLREEFQTANRQLRQDHDRLREAIAQIGERLARIEGFMGIGIPSGLDESTGPEPD